MAETTDVGSPGARTRVHGRFWRVVENAANVLTIVAALLLSVTLLKVFLVPRWQVPVQTAKESNLRALMPDVDWAKNGRTLILYISTQCHFCTESLPFFQKVAKEAGRHVKLLAILPESKSDGEQYLAKGGVRVEDVRQVPAGLKGLQGTPTLLLADGNGTVKEQWEGKLPPDKEKEVLAALKNIYVEKR